MKAITVKYIPQTATKPARLKAFDNAGNQQTYSRDTWMNLDGQELHQKAAESLRDLMNWKGELVGGGIKNGYVFCFKHQ